MTAVRTGSLNEDTADAGDRASPTKPLSLAGLQIRYDDAVRDARKKLKDLLDQVDRNQQDKRSRLDGDSYWKFWHWVQDLDLEAPGITEELKKANADLKRLRKDELAADVEMLGYACSRIEGYRFLMNLRGEKK
jgi:septation ring formation regulator EzrA